MNASSIPSEQMLPFKDFETIYHDLFSAYHNLKGTLPSSETLAITHVLLFGFVACFQEFCRKQINALAQAKELIGHDKPVSLDREHSFDSSDELNSAFFALVGTNPLSNEEAEQYSKILAQLHLLPQPNATVSSEQIGLSFDKLTSTLFELSVTVARVTGGSLKSALNPTSKNYSASLSAVDLLMEGRYGKLE